MGWMFVRVRGGKRWRGFKEGPEVGVKGCAFSLCVCSTIPLWCRRGSDIWLPCWIPKSAWCTGVPKGFLGGREQPCGRSVIARSSCIAIVVDARSSTSLGYAAWLSRCCRWPVWCSWTWSVSPLKSSGSGFYGCQRRPHPHLLLSHLHPSLQHQRRAEPLSSQHPLLCPQRDPAKPELRNLSEYGVVSVGALYKISFVIFAENAVKCFTLTYGEKL